MAVLFDNGAKADFRDGQGMRHYLGNAIACGDVDFINLILDKIFSPGDAIT